MTNQETSTNVNEVQLFENYSHLTPDQWRFVTARLEEKSDKDAAFRIGINPSTVSRWENKKQIDNLLAEIQASTAIAAKAVLEKQVLKASMVLLGLLDSDDERIRIDAAKQVLDRVNGKPVNKNEVTGADGGPVILKGYGIVSPDDWDNDGD